MKEAKKYSQVGIGALLALHQGSTYYEHHNMPARNASRNLLRRSPKTKRQITSPEGFEARGREIYPDVAKRIDDPGPGAYDWGKVEPKSFRFSSHTNFNRKTSIPKSNKIGPGFYKYQDVSSNFLSKHKRAQSTRFIKATKSQERLVFQMTQSPGPAKYKQQNYKKMSNYNETTSHKISNTMRSSLVSNITAPGPGYYNSSTLFSTQKQKKKPRIQYKFVYGHAS